MTLSYHNDPDLKARAVEQAKHHRDSDMLAAGIYGKMDGHFKGCSVGCDAYDIKGAVVKSGCHEITAEYFGFPEWLEHLRDYLFENLSEADRRDFHVRLKEAVPVGVDLEPVRHKLTMRRLDRLIALQTEALGKNEGDVKAAIEQVIAALQQVRRCHEAESSSDHCEVDWSAAARSAARSAAWSAESAARSAAARSAARSAAWSAAESAAWSAESAAESAAWSAESAAWSAESAWSAAESAAVAKQEAADLLELLAAA